MSAILMKRFLKEMCVLEIASGLSKIAQDIVLLDDYISLDCYPFFQNASPLPPGAARIFTVNWQGPYWKIYVPGGSIP